MEGECPYCDSPGTWGEQCDNFRKLVRSTELANPRSKATGDTKPELHENEHLFIDLIALTYGLDDRKDHLRPSAIDIARDRVGGRTADPLLATSIGAYRARRQRANLSRMVRGCGGPNGATMKRRIGSAANSARSWNRTAPREAFEFGSGWSIINL